MALLCVIKSFAVLVWLKFRDHLADCASRSRFSSSSEELVGMTLVIGPIWEGDGLSPGVMGRLHGVDGCWTVKEQSRSHNNAQAGAGLCLRCARRSKHR